MLYKAKNYTYLYGVPGFSRALLKTHFTLYQGYVKNVNRLLKELGEMGDKTSACYAELKRRFGWEFCGMRLHEYYFDNLGCRPLAKSHGAFIEYLRACFGGFDAWRDDFIHTGLMRGVGWAILFRDNQTGNLMNVWIEQHDKGHLAGCQPILVMDVWEHAYLCEFGLDRQSYIDTFLNSVDWNAVYERFARVGA